MIASRGMIKYPLEMALQFSAASADKVMGQINFWTEYPMCCRCSILSCRMFVDFMLMEFVRTYILSIITTKAKLIYELVQMNNCVQFLQLCLNRQQSAFVLLMFMNYSVNYVKKTWILWSTSCRRYYSQSFQQTNTIFRPLVKFLPSTFSLLMRFTLIPSFMMILLLMIHSSRQYYSLQFVRNPFPDPVASRWPLNSTEPGSLRQTTDCAASTC